MSQTTLQERSSAALIPGPLLIDAHVHLHPAHDLARLFSSAVANAQQAAAKAGLPRPTVGLVIVDMHGQDGFRRLRDGGWTVPGWEMRPTSEPVSLLARSTKGEQVLLFAGRQMATRERLEVLSLFSDQIVPDGLDLGETVRRVQEAGGLPVVPWGFGKWTGQRKSLLKAWLREPPRPVFLGDSGGRPALDRMDGMFAEAAGRSIWNLPGTDPLPLPWEEGRAGSCGLVLHENLPEDRPAEALYRQLTNMGSQPDLYGERRNPVGFLVSQIGLRLVRRKGAGGAAISRPA